MAANHHPRTLAAALLGLAVICSLTAASAQSRAVSVSGTQTLVDEQAGTYKMHGDLVGDWQITALKEIPSEGLFQAKGRELFDGCLDKDHDDACGSGTPRASSGSCSATGRSSPTTARCSAEHGT